jgi:four helix bundle protein
MIMERNIKSFTQLDVWKEAHQLVLMIYRVTKNFPRDELFGLISQLRRCAVSVTSNIAEGFGRLSYKEKVCFYTTSVGSLTELQNQILVAKDVGYLSVEEYQKIFSQSERVYKILNGLLRATKNYI